MPVSLVPSKSPKAQTAVNPGVPATQWIPVLFGLSVICVESTRFMGGAQTGKVLSELWQAVFGQWDLSHVGEINHILRKAGHFTGYGTLALLLRRAWFVTVRSYLAIARTRLILSASALSVLCTCLVACMDEWHQSFLPGRTSKLSDVLLDTLVAALFNGIFWGVRSYRRRALLPSRTAHPVKQLPLREQRGSEIHDLTRVA